MSKVEWSDEARKNFRNTIRYIAYEFGKKAVRKFEANIAQWENLIAMNPAMGPKEPLLQGLKREYRSVVVHRYCKLVYYAEGDTLYIAPLWDTRREPRAQTANLE